MDDRPDLAPMAMRVGRALTAAQQPILTTHEVSAWGYQVLSALFGRQVRAQAALARVIGADKTRIIRVLDDLQERGLIERQVDPGDRRVHLLRLTAAGAELHAAVRADVRHAEQRLLEYLPPTDRVVFLRSMEILAEVTETRSAWP